MAQQVMGLVAKSKERPEFNSQNPHSGRREPTPLNCSLAPHMHSMACECAHTYTHTEHINKLIKILNRFMIRNPKLIIHTNKEVKV